MNIERSINLGTSSQVGNYTSMVRTIILWENCKFYMSSAAEFVSSPWIIEKERAEKRVYFRDRC
jgi:hypothetical protein